MPSLIEIGEFINRIGLPTTVVLMLAFAFWRIFKASALAVTFVAPKVTALAEAHMTFLEKTSAVQEQQVKIISDFREAHAETATKVDQIHEAVVRQAVRP